MRRAALINVVAIAILVLVALVFAGEWYDVPVDGSPPARGAFSAFSFPFGQPGGTDGWVWGGYNSQVILHDLGHLFKVNNGLRWSDGSPAGQPPDGYTYTEVAELGNRACIFGGLSNSGVVVNSIDCFYPAQNRWIPVTGITWTPVANGAASAIDDHRVLISGGWTNQFNGTKTDLVQLLDLDLKTWNEVGHLAVAIAGHSQVWYPELQEADIFLGETNGGFNLCDINVRPFSNDPLYPNKIFTSDPIGGLVGRTRAASVRVGSGFLLIGGATASGITNQVLHYEAGQGLRVADALPYGVAYNAALFDEAGLGSGVQPTPTYPLPTPTPYGGGYAFDEEAEDTQQMASGLTGQVPRAKLLVIGGWTGTAFTNQTQEYASNIAIQGGGPDQTLPTVAHLKGRGGVLFTSRIDLLNVGSSTMTVEVTYTPRQDIGGSAATSTLTLPAGIQRTVEDPLAIWFGLGPNDTGVGTLIFRVIAGSPMNLLVQSVILARNPNGTEFGQELVATSINNAIIPGWTTYFPTTQDTAHNRVNFASVGLEDGTQVSVRLLDRVGHEIAPAKTYALDQGDSLQLNDVFNTFAVAPRDNTLIEYKTITGWSLGYGSVLDGNQGYTGTSDPTTSLGVFGGSPRLTFLEVGRIQGLNEFSGSAIVTNYASITTIIQADFYERGKPGVAASTTFTIPAGQSMGWDDVVGGLFGLTGKVGTVVLTQLNSTPIGGAAREFAIYRDGQGNVVGTAGQRIPALTDGRRLRPLGLYHFLGLRQTGTTAGKERTHLDAFNPGTTDATLAAKLFDGATGTLEGQSSWTVRAGELKRIDFVLSAIKSSVDGSPKRLVVTVSAPMFVEAFRVNKDGDSITLDPFRH